MASSVNSYHNAIFEDVFFDDQYLYLYDFTKKIYKIIGNYIGVKELKTNLETNTVNVVLEFLPLSGEEIQEHEVSLNQALSISQLENLNLYGMDIHSLNKTIVLKQIRNGLNGLQSSFYHTQMGFSKHQEKLVFKHYKLLGTSNNVNSNYGGSYNIEPLGTLECWMDMFNKEVRGYIPLELAVVFGLSAPIIGLIGDQIHTNSQLIHLVGNSSVGKTTALQLAVSTFGSPVISPDSLLLTYNATQNSLIAKLSGNMGVPMALDEASMIPNKDWTDFLYIVTCGEDKERMTKELKLVQRNSFRTVVLSSGEYSIVSKAANNMGIHGRVLEYSGVKWTKDSNNSNSIKSVCSANYGLIGPLFVEELMKLSQESLIRTHHNLQKKIQKRLKNSQIRDRIAQKLGVYMLTAYIAKQKLELDLDLNGILDFIIENENRKITDIDIAVKAYEYINEVYSKNPHRFLKNNRSNNGRNSTSQHERWGFYIVKNSGNTNKEIVSQLGIAEEQLRILLESDNKFQSMDVIVQAWLEKGWVIKDKDRIFQRRAITPNSRTKCCVLNIEKIERDLYGGENHENRD